MITSTNQQIKISNNAFLPHRNDKNFIYLQIVLHRFHSPLYYQE